MDLGLRGKKAVVMGASAGIGRGIAEALLKEGARVAICARNKKRLTTAAKEIKASLAIPCDLFKTGDVLNLFKIVEEKFHGIDVVVFNTGGPETGHFLDLSLEKWRMGFQTLWEHVLIGLQTVLPKMKSQHWGRILIVTSVAAKEPVSGLTLSNALRAGLLGLINSVSREVGEYGITINTLMPGYIKTERLADLGVSEEKLLGQVPMKRIGLPSDVGALAAFLASQKASYITGQAIACDGGYLRGI